jgi:hypothetical protein
MVEFMGIDFGGILHFSNGVTFTTGCKFRIRNKFIRGIKAENIYN